MSSKRKHEEEPENKVLVKKQKQDQNRAMLCPHASAEAMAWDVSLDSILYDGTRKYHRDTHELLFDLWCVIPMDRGQMAFAYDMLFNHTTSTIDETLDFTQIRNPDGDNVLDAQFCRCSGYRNVCQNGRCISSPFFHSACVNILHQSIPLPREICKIVADYSRITITCNRFMWIIDSPCDCNSHHAE